MNKRFYRPDGSLHDLRLPSPKNKRQGYSVKEQKHLYTTPLHLHVSITQSGKSYVHAWFPVAHDNLLLVVYLGRPYHTTGKKARCRGVVPKLVRAFIFGQSSVQ